MTTGPQDPAASRDRLRAGHADREQVIEALKTAFVDGRLTKIELVARTGRALAGRTYADLAALTADIPAEAAAVVPGRPARLPRRSGWRVFVGLRSRARRPAAASAGATIVCRWGGVFRLQASSCSDGGTPRPERPTMTPISVQLVERGDGGEMCGAGRVPPATPRVCRVFCGRPPGGGASGDRGREPDARAGPHGVGGYWGAWLPGKIQLAAGGGAGDDRTTRPGGQP